MNKLAILVILIIAGLLFGVTSNAIVNSVDYPNSDFFSFWLAGRMILSQQDPYAMDAWISGHEQYGATWISDPTFLYPLPLAFFFLPLSLLDLKSAYIVWVWISQVFLLLVLILLLPYFGSGRKHYLLPLILGLTLFRPLVSLLLNGQIGGFSLLVIIIAALLWEKEHWFWGGSVISLSFLKPNTGVPILALICLYLLVRKHYRALIGIGLTGIIIFAAAAVYDPNWVWEYLEVLKLKQAQTFGFSPTIWGISALIRGFDSPLTIVLGSLVSICLGITLLLMVIRRIDIPSIQITALAASIAILITPYLWPYDQIILVFSIIMTVVILKNMQKLYLFNALLFILVDIAGWVLFGFSTLSQLENINGVLSLMIVGLHFWALARYHPPVADQSNLSHPQDR